jgi:hypothetical protein
LGEFLEAVRPDMIIPVVGGGDNRKGSNFIPAGISRALGE